MKNIPLEIISKSALCRSYLYIAGFLTDSEAEKVHSRIRKYQDKHRQNVSSEDIGGVRLVMGTEIKRLNQRIAELEAQMPMVVDPAFNCGDYDCPECEFRSLYRLWKYCPQCGAKLNWEEK